MLRVCGVSCSQSNFDFAYCPDAMQKKDLEMRRVQTRATLYSIATQRCPPQCDYHQTGPVH